MTSDYYTARLGEPSNSLLRHLRRSPLAYWDHVVNGGVDDTDAMRYGRVFHMALLERERFDREHLVLPSGKFNSLDGKIAWLSAVTDLTGVDLSEVDPSLKADDLRAYVCTALQRHGRAPMTERDLEVLRGQVASLNRPENEMVRRLITACETEVEIHWTELDVCPKARLDLLHRDRLFAADVKTTEDADPEEFRRSVTAYGYHYQEAMYRRAVSAKYGVDARITRDEWGHLSEPEFDFVFALAGKSRPYHWAWARIDPELVADADEEITRNLDTLSECIRTNVWPGRMTPEPIIVHPYRRIKAA